MSDNTDGERVEVSVPSGVWLDLPGGRGSVYQDSGGDATVTLTEDQTEFGGEPGIRWIWRSVGYNPDHGFPVIPITFDTRPNPEWKPDGD